MKDFLKIFGPVAVAIIACWIGWWAYATLVICSMTERGQLGDLFGGINALFSGLALAGVVTAVILQSKELRLQREAMANQLHEMELSRHEITLQREQLELQKEELKLSREELGRTATANEGSAKALAKQHAIQLMSAKLEGLNTVRRIINEKLEGARPHSKSTQDLRIKLSHTESSIEAIMEILSGSPH